MVNPRTKSLLMTPGIFFRKNHISNKGRCFFKCHIDVKPVKTHLV